MPSTDKDTDLIDLINAFEGDPTYQSLCPNRIWQAWQAHSKYSNDPSHFLLLLREYGATLKDALRHEDHSACNFDFCEFSSRNFTAVQQYHEPRPHEVDDGEEGEQAKIAENHIKNKEVCFPLRGLFNEAKLAKAVHAGELTPWTLDGFSILPSGRPFMAISHVWSDGTGVGTWATKEVNECLYGYFRGVAERFHCEGIWWDTLCVPRDRVARSKALSMMIRNYEEARVTLVHDRFLRNLPFQRPDLACLAIVMSPWFTRGWTALELAKSRRVKIVFKDSIKDLDQDILRKVDESSAFINTSAAKVINKFRQDQISGIEDLLVALGPRYTSWLKDRAAIAGLLAGVEIADSGGSQDTFQRDIYQCILKKMGKVSHDHLFHKSVTMPRAFSWCPTSLFQLPHATQDYHQFQGRRESFKAQQSPLLGADNASSSYPSPRLDQLQGGLQQDNPLTSTSELTVNENGEVVGLWKPFPLESVHHEMCVWGQSHELIEAKLRAALQVKNKKHHLLLVPPRKGKAYGEDMIRKGLIVKVLQSPCRNKEKEPGYKCQFVGSLYFQPALDPTALLSLQGSAPALAKITIGDTEGWNLLGENENAWDIVEKKRDALVLEEPTKQQAKEEVSGSRISSQSQDSLRLSMSYNHTKDELHIASERGDANRVRFLLGEGHDANGRDSDGQTPLHCAMWGGSLETVRLLVGHKADIFARNKAGNTTLHIAADVGFEPAARYLCDLSLEVCGEGQALEVVQSRGSNGLTPLHCAAISGHHEIAELLIDRNTTIDIEDVKIGWTPLHCAAENGHVSVVELLLSKGAGAEKTDDKVGWTPLHLAAMNGHISVVKKLLKSSKGADVNKMDLFGWTPLLFAAMNGHKKVVRELVSRGVKVNATLNWTSEDVKNWGAVIRWIKRNNDTFINSLKWTRLHLAAIDWRTRITQSLLDRDMDIDTTLIQGGDSLLRWAAGDGRNRVIGFLVTVGVNLETKDQNHWRPLHHAIAKGHEAVVVLLVSLGANIEVMERFSLPLLAWAARGGYADISGLLVELGAETTTTNGMLQPTPLWHAVQERQAAVVQVLAEKNADLEDRRYDETPLQSAASRGHRDVVQVLVNNGADIEAKDTRGRTALSKAATEGHEDVVELLVEMGADVAKPLYPSGKTVLEWAVEHRHEAIMKAVQTQLGIEAFTAN